MKTARLFTLLVTILTVGASPAVGDAKMSTRAGKQRHNRASRVHVVKRGQTLWQIARVHGCSLRALQRANGSLNARAIRIGQKLRIPRCGSEPARTKKAARTRRGGSSREPKGIATDLLYKVRRGDNLGKIARRYDCSVRHLRRHNRLRSSRIRKGQTLRIIPGMGGKGRALPGQSLGQAHHGRLTRGAQLASGRGYFRRRVYRAWGANQTIHHIKRMVRHVRRKYRRIHDLSIGDVSAKRGGRLATHKSHQSGRDVDIGYYFKKRPENYPKHFYVATASNMHMGANWRMLRYFAATSRSNGGVQRIFMNYSLQRAVYKWAQKKRISKRLLDSMFQYPHGPGAAHGLIRHDPGHDSHIHVRFKCPPRDKKCNQ